MKSEIEKRTKFDAIRYSQVWEDADLIIDALSLKADDIVLSIASAGDNACNAPYLSSRN
ncbi:MAG: BtaA family protein [Dehalococcoidia bacterium]|nr:BtaA family protein [Dehalococcoidia bacterium]